MQNKEKKSDNYRAVEYHISYLKIFEKSICHEKYGRCL